MISEVLDNLEIFGVKSVLAGPQTNGINLQSLADHFYVFKGQVVDLSLRPVAMGAIQIAIVRKSQSNRKTHVLPL